MHKLPAGLSFGHLAAGMHFPLSSRKYFSLQSQPGVHSANLQLPLMPQVLHHLGLEHLTQASFRPSHFSPVI